MKGFGHALFRSSAGWSCVMHVLPWTLSLLRHLLSLCRPPCCACAPPPCVLACLHCWTFACDSLGAWSLVHGGCALTCYRGSWLAWFWGTVNALLYLRHCCCLGGAPGPWCSRLYVLASSVLILGCLPCSLCFVFVSLGHSAKARGTIKLAWTYVVWLVAKAFPQSMTITNCYLLLWLELVNLIGLAWWGVAEAHSNLCHFPVLLANRLGAESCLAGEFTSPRVPLSTSLLVMRLWSGGQSLRGGDRARVGPPLIRSLCAFCSGFGGQVPEDLQHFLLECPLTDGPRRHLHSSVKQLLLEPWNHRVGNNLIDTCYGSHCADVAGEEGMFHSTSLAHYECMDQIQVPWTANRVEKSLIECIMLLALAIMYSSISIDELVERREKAAQVQPKGSLDLNGN